MIRFEIDPDKKLGKAFQDKLDKIDDLRIPLNLIRESWFKSNLAFFALHGPGKFADLTPKYKEEKQKSMGFVYPILYRDGLLKSALTDPGSIDSATALVGKKTLVVGVNPGKDYFRYLQTGTKKMKARPYILLGAEQVAPSGINNRAEAWRKLIINYVIDVTEGKST